MISRITNAIKVSNFNPKSEVSKKATTLEIEINFKVMLYFIDGAKLTIISLKDFQP